MKTIILLSILLASVSSFSQQAKMASNPKCEVASLDMTPKSGGFTWTLNSKSTYKKWLFVKNLDTNLLYPKQEIIKKSGTLVKGEFPKNAKGYEVVVMDTSKEESDKLTSHLKTCSQIKDCSMPMTLKRCVIAKRSLK